MGSPQLGALIETFYQAANNELEAEKVAGDIIAMGTPGIDAVAQLLGKVSGETPKLAVAILNALQGHITPYAEQVMIDLIERGQLSNEDSTYLSTILAREGASPEARRKLVSKLRRAKDPVNRSDLLAEIVRLNVVEATGVLTELVAELDSATLDYERTPNEAARNEMVRFALLALKGAHKELITIVLDRANHPYRRSAALQILAFSLGDGSMSLLERVILDGAREVRVAVMRSAEYLPGRQALTLAEEGLRDYDGWVCIVAAGVLERLLEKQGNTMDLDRLVGVLATLQDAEGKHPGDRTLIKALQRISRRITTLRRSTPC